MRQIIKIIYSILAVCCVIFLANCDDTNFRARKLSSSPVKGSSDGTGQPQDIEVEDPTIVDTSTSQTRSQLQPQSQVQLIDPDLKYIQEHPEIQAGRSVKVCIAYALPASGHNCDQAKFDLFFNNETTSHFLNLDNVTEREVTTISGHKLKVSHNLTHPSSPIPSDFSDAEKQLIRKHRLYNHVPGTLYETVWLQDGSITTLLKCKAGQKWGTQKLGTYMCHVGTAVISIMGEVQISDGSIKYLATELVKFQTKNEAKQSFSYIGAKNGKTTGNVKFHLSDTPYEFDDYCGFKK